ncbi:MAG: GFA family protein [Polyangiaceae bacterium]|nr:GFA family protein [Polyangiaceae bacterium]
MRYEGRCHCGKLRFAFRSEPITTGKRCNCSICKRKGAVMSSTYFPAEDFEPIENVEELSDYRWGDHDVNHLFCKTCGIYPYHGDDGFGYRVNLGCVDAIDVMSLDVGIIDGKSL